MTFANSWKEPQNLFSICCLQSLYCLWFQAVLKQKAHGSANISSWRYQHIQLSCHHWKISINAGCHFYLACLRKVARCEESFWTSPALEGKGMAQSFLSLVNLYKALKVTGLCFFIWKRGPWTPSHCEYLFDKQWKSTRSLWTLNTYSNIRKEECS